MVHICKTLSALHPRMPFAKFGSNWPGGSGENDLIFKFSQCNFAISI